MARNLGRTSCNRCGHAVVKLDEEPRPITQAEAGIYFDEYEKLEVAKAHCPICQTKYLAWVDESETRYFGRAVGSIAHPRTAQEAPYFDLSYQSTFDDEPGAGDFVNYVKVDRVENIVTLMSAEVVVVQTIKTIRLKPISMA